MRLCSDGPIQTPVPLCGQAQDELPSYMAASKLAEDAASMFKAYDADTKGHLDGSELQKALGDLGAKHGYSASRLSKM